MQNSDDIGNMVSAAGSGCHGVFKYKFCRWNWSASNRSVCRWCIYGQVQVLMSISDNIGKMNSSQMSKALINQVMQNSDDIGNGICGRRWLSRVVRGVMLHALRSHPSPCLDLATLMIITMVLLTDVNGGEVENVETGGALCEQNWSQRQQQPGKCTWTFSFTSPPIGPIFLSHTNLSHVQVFRIPILPSTKAQVSHMHAILLQWHHQATGAGVNPIFL